MSKAELKEIFEKGLDPTFVANHLRRLK